MALGTVAACDLKGIGSALSAQQDKSKVFFTDDISADGLVRIYSRVNQEITGRTAIKVHTGEPNGPNILPRDMVKALQQHIPDSILKGDRLSRGSVGP